MTDDTNIHNGMTTKVWGPPGWFFLRCITFGFPVDPAKFDEEKGLHENTTRTAYYKFFMNVGDILPCKYCRESYKEFLKDGNIGPPDVTNRDSLVEWFWKMHNRVNTKLGDKYEDADLESVKEKYEEFRARCDKNKIENGCSVPLNGKKLCSKVEIYPCPNSSVAYEVEGFSQTADVSEKNTGCKKRELLILICGFIILRILFGILYEMVCSQ